MMKRFVANLSLVTLGVVLGSVIAPLISDTVSAAAGPQYKIVIRPVVATQDEFIPAAQKQLNDMSAQGWTLDQADGAFLIFKK